MTVTEIGAVFSFPRDVRHGLTSGLTMKNNRFVLFHLSDTDGGFVVDIRRLHYG